MAQSARKPAASLAIPFSARTPLRKQIGWHIGQAAVHGTVMTITPDDAKELLERNKGDGWHNRPISRSTIDKYVKEMAEGRWQLTGEPLIFSHTGKLRNGQHRLMACIKGAVAFTTMVVFGVEDATFAVIDRGRVRSVGDIFSSDGVVYYNRTAASVVWVWKYLNNRMNFGGIGVPSAELLLEYFRTEHPGIADSLHIASIFDATKEKLVRASLMVALHYLCAKEDAVLADRFFNNIANGLDIKSKRSPAYKVRQRLLEARLVRDAVSPHSAAAMTINAWNATRERKPLAKEGLFYDPTQPFPTII